MADSNDKDVVRRRRRYRLRYHSGWVAPLQPLQFESLQAAVGETAPGDAGDSGGGDGGGV